MAFFGPNNKLLIGDNGIVISSFDSDGVSATTIASTEFSITSSNPDAGANFGESVAVGSGRIVVGEPKFDYSSVDDIGSVYIYNLDGALASTEIYGAILSSSTYLGGSVAVGGGRIASGNSGSGNFSGLYTWDLDGENRSGLQGSAQMTTTVDIGSGKLVVGHRAYDSAPYDGKIEIWDIYDNHAGSNENMLANQTPITIVSPDSSGSMLFGSEVSVGHGKILSTSLPLNSNSNPIHLFDAHGNFIKGLKPADWGSVDYYGGGGNYHPHATDIGCGLMIVGAYLADSDGVAGGKAYVYDLNGNEKFQLIASDRIQNDWFGMGVAIGSNRIAVGASGWNNDQGKVYIYNLQGDSVEQITASDGAAGDEFGTSLAFGNNRLIVGAPKASSAAGKVYGYKLDGTTDTYFEDVLDTVGNNKWA